ncbi:ATP-binding protein [Chryseolinea sp. T2]|uniref:sensor histidine kinase n=1 Tax=Chryseolinea sp. T2 TaxID=3129255 RepID=UPI003076CA39
MYAVVAVLSAMLLINVLLTRHNSEIIEYNKNLQAEAEKIKVNTLDIIRTIHQMDMGLRGYALINSPVQLKVTTDGFIKMDSVLGNLEAVLSQQGFDMNAFTVLKDSTSTYLNTIRHMTALVHDGKHNEFNAILTKDLGLNAYFAYVIFSDQVMRFENNVAAAAVNRYQDARASIYWLQVAMFLLTVPALFHLVIYSKKMLKVSEALRIAEKRSVDLLSHQNEELERQVHHRTTEILAQNEEISAQNEEIAAHNEQLVLQREEIERQRNVLADNNVKLEIANSTIARQNEFINDRNEALVREINKQTRHLRETNDELLQQNTRLEQFAYIISHNMRGPIARLVGLAVILKTAKDQTEKDRIIQMMIKSTEDFDNVLADVSKILSIQKLNTETYTDVSLAGSFEKATQLLQAEIHSTGAQITTNFLEVPALFSLSAYIDSILFNLVSNSIKYRHPDRPPRINLKSEIRNGFHVLSIKDNGLGIDTSRYKDSLFQLYKRFHHHVEGKGLGLYLVRTQVEALSGKIEVDSKLSVGTTFRIFFKVSDNGQ